MAASVNVYSTVINILSAQFPSVCLRMDAKTVSGMTPSGSGIVNCQFVSDPFDQAFPWEKFRLVSQSDGTVAIWSVAFPKAFLRMDGTGVTQFSAGGGGTVNAQGGVGAWEKFHLRPQGGLRVAIESAAFPGVFLRMDGNGVTAPTGPGAGKVNCQVGAHSWERFYLVAA